MIEWKEDLFKSCSQNELLKHHQQRCVAPPIARGLITSGPFRNAITISPIAGRKKEKQITGNELIVKMMKLVSASIVVHKLKPKL